MGLALLTAPPGMAGSGGCANAGADIGSLSTAQARGAIICLFNNARSAQSVQRNGDLQQAAQKHTDRMRSEECFRHDCPGEPGLKQRVENTGYFNGAGQVGEVIAFGDDGFSPNDFVDEWLDSNAHRGIIQRAAFRDVGVGVSVQGGNALLTAVLGKS